LGRPPTTAVAIKLPNCGDWRQIAAAMATSGLTWNPSAGAQPILHSIFLLSVTHIRIESDAEANQKRRKMSQK
jgi:hypothetical protein